MKLSFSRSLRCLCMVSLTMWTCHSWGQAWFTAAASPSNTFFSTAQTRGALGYRVISLSSANNFISAVWLRDYAPAQLELFVPYESLQTNAATLQAQGYRPISLAVYGQAPDDFYLVSYVKDNKQSSLFARLTGAELITLTSGATGSRVAWVQNTGVGDSARYAGVLARDGLSGKLEVELEEGALTSAISSYREAGYRPVCIFGKEGASGMAYTANWVQETKRWTNRFNLSFTELNAYTSTLNAQRLRADAISQYPGADQSLRFSVVAVEDLPIWTITGNADPGLEAFDTAMTNAMKVSNCTRASLAVSKNGRLVASRGYTYHLASAAPTQPTNMFRVASISKTITAVTIMGLVEAGKLALDDKLGKFIDLSGVVDSRWTNITVRHLLQHRAGWDRATFDPVLNDVTISTVLRVPLPITKDHIITYTKTRPLQTAPGTTYSYANFGYLLLGRIIEQVTSQDYETFVRQNVLAPLGIHSARVGRTDRANRLPGEVEYEEGTTTYPSVLSPSRPLVATPYGRYNIDNFDSLGAWVISAEDLVRYCSIFTEKTNCALLFPQTIDTMWAPAPQEPAPPPTGWFTYYTCGWVVQRLNAGEPIYMFHDGALPGTSTLMVRQATGYSWAALFNTRNETGTSPVTALGGGLDIINATAAITQWPTNDFFDIDADALPDSYEVAHFGSLNASDGNLDHDGDGLSDAAEWVALSSPLDSTDGPRLNSQRRADGAPLLQVASHGGRIYSVHAISALGQSWDTSTLLTRFNGDGFRRTLPLSATEPSGFYRLSVGLRAKPLSPLSMPGALPKSAPSIAGPAQVWPGLAISTDVVRGDDALR